jgi:hypothetical protein
VEVFLSMGMGRCVGRTWRCRGRSVTMYTRGASESGSIRFTTKGSAPTPEIGTLPWTMAGLKTNMAY